MEKSLTYADIRDDEDFKNFVREKFNKDATSISSYEEDAMLYAYSSQNDEVSGQDLDGVLEKISNVKSSEEVQKQVAQQYFPEKEFDDLTTMEQTYVKLVVNSLEQEKNYGEAMSLDQVEDILKYNEEYNEDYYDNSHRERSYYSDENDNMLDMLRVMILQEMGKIEESPEESSVQSNIDTLNKTLPSLNDEELKDFENRLTNKMLEDEALFVYLPPSVLAKKYRELRADREEIENTPEQESNNESENSEDYENEVSPKEAKLAEYDAKIAKIEERMDNLTDMVVEQKGLFFADKTNIADVYDAYTEMFEAREEGLNKDAESGRITEERSAEIKDKIIDGKDILTPIYESYLKDYGLNRITEKDAGKLNDKFDEMDKVLQGTQVDGATLSLVSNFKFFDENGETKPQFMDKDGIVSDVYSEGATVIKGSELDKVITLAKQDVLLENLTSREKTNKEKIQAEVSGKLPEVLYALHVTSEVENGIAERPSQFTDRKYLDEFLNNLSDPQQEMSITPTAFNAGINRAVNTTAGYAKALSERVGADKEVVGKVFKPIESIDKRSNARMEDGKPQNKNKVRIEMLKRAVKGGLSALVVSGGITTLGTMAATDASLTASTMGLNKLAGMALGSTMAVGMTIRQIYKWRKNQKQQGKSAGLKAFLKDRKMVMTVATTALGATALGFAATGNPGVASALGIGALAVGTTNGVISNYQDATKQGLGKFESAGWAALQAISNVAGAYGGRIGANMAIDAWNQSHPDSNLFQHKEVIGQRETIIEERHDFEYKDGVVERAQQTLGKWYNGNEDLLQQQVNEINAYNAEHGTNINPYRYLLAAHDAGAQAPDNMLLHNQDAPDVHSGGNHKVLGSGWSEETGISQESVNNLANSVADGHVTISEDSIDAFRQIDGHINKYNQVGYVEGAPYQDDKVLAYNANIEDGKFVSSAQNGDRYTTYANGESVYQEAEVKREVVAVEGMVRNEGGGYGMFGVVGNFMNGVKKLKDRAGALLDKIVTPEHTEPVNLPETESQQTDKKALKVNVDAYQAENVNDVKNRVENRLEASNREKVTTSEVQNSTNQEMSNSQMNNYNINRGNER